MLFACIIRVDKQDNNKINQGDNMKEQAIKNITKAVVSKIASDKGISIQECGELLLNDSLEYNNFERLCAVAVVTSI